MHVVGELRSWLEVAEFRREVSERGREGTGTQAVPVFSTRPARSDDGEQSDPALSAIDRPHDMGDAVCKEGHGQEQPEEAPSGQDRPGRPQVWTMTSRTQSLCNMTVGMDLRKVRDGPE